MLARALMDPISDGIALGGADVIALAWTDRELHGRQADKQLFSDERSESSSVNSSSSCP